MQRTPSPAWYSNDNVLWTQLGHVSAIDVATDGPIFVGVAVTSHGAAATTAAADSFRIQ